MLHIFSFSVTICININTECWLEHSFNIYRDFEDPLDIQIQIPGTCKHHHNEALFIFTICVHV